MFYDWFKIIYIMMRKVFKTKDFKGSIFVEFSTEEEAKKVISQEKLMFKGQELTKMFR